MKIFIETMHLNTKTNSIFPITGRVLFTAFLVAVFAILPATNVALADNQQNELISITENNGGEFSINICRFLGHYENGVWVESDVTEGILGVYSLYLSVHGKFDISFAKTKCGEQTHVNKLPVADAGPDQTSKAGDVVAFDGSGSKDEDGQIILYTWNFGDGSSATSTTSATIDHTYTTTGNYTATLVVKDNEEASSNPDTASVVVSSKTQCSDGIDNDGDLFIDSADPACHTNGDPTKPYDPNINDENSKPVAILALPASAYVNAPVALDGTASHDLDGEIVLYEWNFGDGSPIATSTNATTTHEYTATSTYTVTLVVTDNENATSTPDTAVITVATQCSDGKDNDGDHKIDFSADPGCSSRDDNDEKDVNARPIADAGPDKVVTLGDEEIFDGSGSTDDGEIVLYEWNFGDGSPLEATSTTAIPHIYAATSTYTVTLVVTDNDGATSTPDTAVITVATQCSDGKDNDGDHKIDFPTDPGCSSGDDNDEKDVNVRPIADAGPDKVVTLGDEEIFDGADSTDSDGEIVLYEWNFGDGSPLATTTSSEVKHVYTATSTFTITLIVKDNDGATSTPDTAVITVATQCSDGKDNDGDHKIDYPTDPGCSSHDDNDEKDVNARPIADAGPDKVVTLGDDEPFDGSHSFDNDGEIISYYWDFGDGSTTTRNVATTTHAYTATSTFTIRLVVTDNEGATSTPDTVTVTIAPQCFDGKDNDGDHKIDYPTDPGCRWYDDNDERDVNARPIADAGPDKVVTLGDAAFLDGSGSTDDKKIAFYEWNFGDGSTTTSAIATTTRTYTATSTYIITLTVTDDEGAVSEPDTAIITVATQCSDGKDNDGDGKIDYPEDKGCSSDDDNDEKDNALPVAVLSVSPNSDHINKPISLNGTESYDSDGAIALYEWNFGDGVMATTTTSTASHSYSTSNTYTIALVVTDNKGATSTPATKTVIITTPPTGCTSNCGGGGGGGGPVLPPSQTLVITNEKAEQGPLSGTSVVTWTTNLPSDSRVVYGTSSVLLFPAGDQKYGYAKTTVTVSPLVTLHTIAISGLDPNLTYYFRPVSRTSSLSATGKELTLAPGGCYYLREFIKYGANNNPTEVKKLQAFLNEFEGANLPITGFYGLADFNAVSTFQTKYKTDVIDPWGETTTGYVYLTTRKKVNEIYCRAAFPLDGTQTAEVNAFRALIESLRAEGIVAPTQEETEANRFVPQTGLVNGVSDIALSLLNGSATTTPGIDNMSKNSVTDRGSLRNMLAGAYGTVAGTISTYWLALVLVALLFPAGFYAKKMLREEANADTDDKDLNE